MAHWVECPIPLGRCVSRVIPWHSSRRTSLLYKRLPTGSVWGIGVGLWSVFLPSGAWAYLPRYVHVTLGLPWFAYLIFLMGVLVPVFLYLGISWYFKKELERTGHGKSSRDEDMEE